MQVTTARQSCQCMPYKIWTSEIKLCGAKSELSGQTLTEYKLSFCKIVVMVHIPLKISSMKNLLPSGVCQSSKMKSHNLLISMFHIC